MTGRSTHRHEARWFRDARCAGSSTSGVGRCAGSSTSWVGRCAGVPLRIHVVEAGDHDLEHARELATFGVAQILQHV